MTFTEQCEGTLLIEACLDVAQFALVIARKTQQGAYVPRPVQDLPTEWALAARAVLPAADEHTLARDRKALKGWL